MTVFVLSLSPCQPQGRLISLSEASLIPPTLLPLSPPAPSPPSAPTPPAPLEFFPGACTRGNERRGYEHPNFGTASQSKCGCKCDCKSNEVPPLPPPPPPVPLAPLLSSCACATLLPLAEDMCVFGGGRALDECVESGRRMRCNLACCSCGSFVSKTAPA